MNVGILGRGRLGRSLSLLLSRAGHRVDLRGRDEGVPEGDVLLLAVPDAAIGPLARTIPSGPVVLHLSGATDLAPLAHHPEHGSLHPLMTFPGPEVALPELQGVPAAVAGTPRGLEAARDLAGSLGMRPVEVPGDRRLYHAAAVMAGNFATVLLADAAAVLARAGVPREQGLEMLLPLALRSLQGALPDPAAGLTGPHARRDHEVVAAHRDALAEAGLKDHLDLYDLMVGRTRALLGFEDPEPPTHPRGRP